MFRLTPLPLISSVSGDDPPPPIPAHGRSMNTSKNRTTPDLVVSRLTWPRTSATWRATAQRPFAMLDPVAWEATNHAPIDTVLRTTRPHRAAAGIRSSWSTRRGEKTSRAGRSGGGSRQPQGTGSSPQGRLLLLGVRDPRAMQQYSGGLGVLAGDHGRARNSGPAGRRGPPLPAQLLPPAVRGGRTPAVLYPEYDFDRYPIEETDSRSPVRSADEPCRPDHALVMGRTSILLLDADLRRTSRRIAS